MPKSGFIDEISAHRGLETLSEVWIDLAYGRVSQNEAVRRAGSQEPADLVERSARMLSRPTALQSQARLQRLLDEHFTAPRVARPRRWIYGVAALAAAAAVLLFMPLRPTPHGFDAGYELELPGALADERDVGATADAVQRFRLDHDVSWTMRPGHRVDEGVDVRAFAKGADGHTIILRPETRKTAGVVSLRGRPRAWGLEPGRWQLTVVVGPPGGLPDQLADVRMDDDAPYDVAQAWIDAVEGASERP
jgi:hypothetical protein